MRSTHKSPPAKANNLNCGGSGILDTEENQLENVYTRSKLLLGSEVIRVLGKSERFSLSLTFCNERV
jgi:hypothetical protein